MKAPAGIIFDLFHTLTACESQWSEIPNTWQMLGVDKYVWDRALLESSRWRLVGEERDPYAIFRRLVRGVDATIPDTKVREVLARRARRLADCFQRIPDENLAMVERLRAAGHKVALLSNADAMEVAAYDQGHLRGRFDVELFSCDAGAVKPEAAIFHDCLDRLGLEARECVFVGDGGSDELVGARSVGLRTVFVSGVVAEIFPERVAARRALADHHVRWAWEVPDALGLEAPTLETQ